MPAVISTHFSVGYMVPVDLLVHAVRRLRLDHRDQLLDRPGLHVPRARCSTRSHPHVEVHVGGPMHALSALAMGGTGFLSSEGNLVPQLVNRWWSSTPPATTQAAADAYAQGHAGVHAAVVARGGEGVAAGRSASPAATRACRACSLATEDDTRAGIAKLRRDRHPRARGPARRLMAPRRGTNRTIGCNRCPRGLHSNICSRRLPTRSTRSTRSTRCEPAGPDGPDRAAASSDRATRVRRSVHVVGGREGPAPARRGRVHRAPPGRGGAHRRRVGRVPGMDGRRRRSSASSWLAHRAPLSKRDAHQLVRAARLAHRYERTGKALAAGDVSSSHVEVLAAAVKGREVLFDRDEDVLLDVAGTLSHRRLHRSR